MPRVRLREDEPLRFDAGVEARRPANREWSALPGPTSLAIVLAVETLVGVGVAAAAVLTGHLDAVAGLLFRLVVVGALGAVALGWRQGWAARLIVACEAITAALCLGVAFFGRLAGSPHPWLVAAAAVYLGLALVAGRGARHLQPSGC